MADLRWALLLLGTVFLAGLGLWEWRRDRRRRASRAATPAAPAMPVMPVMPVMPATSISTREAPPLAIDNDTEPLHELEPPGEDLPLRREPVISDFGPAMATLPSVEVPIPEMRVGDSLRIGISSEEAVDVPAAAAPAAPAVAQTAPMAAPPFAPGPQFTGDHPLGIDPAAPLDFLLDSTLAGRPQAQPPQAELQPDAAGRTTVEVAGLAPGAPRAEDTQVATDVAPGPPPIRWPPTQLPDRVLGLRVAAPAGRPLAGQQVRLALQAAGLRHGPQQIFHHTDAEGNVLASVANLLRPGNLLPERMDGQHYRGLSLFTVLPGPRPDVELLEGLVSLARALALRLDGIVQDEYGQELDAERLAQLRRAVASSPEPGDGAGA